MLFRTILFILILLISRTLPFAAESFEGSLICKVTSDRVTQVKGNDLKFFNGVKDDYAKGDTLTLDYSYTEDLRFRLKLYPTFRETETLGSEIFSTITADLCISSNQCGNETVIRDTGISYEDPKTLAEDNSIDRYGHKFIITARGTLIYESDITYFEMSTEHIRHRDRFATLGHLQLNKYSKDRYSGYLATEDFNENFIRVSTLDCAGSLELINSLINHMTKLLKDR